MNIKLDDYIKNNQAEIKNMFFLLYNSYYEFLRDENVVYQLVLHVHKNIIKEKIEDVFFDSPLYSILFDIQQELVNNGTLEFYSGSNCSDACDYARIATTNKSITDITLEATKSILEEDNPQIALNPYFINSGYCFEVAEDVCENADTQICTILMMEDQEDFKYKILKTLSDDVNCDFIFKIICGANHEWSFDLDSEIHFDSEVPHGVKNLDDIPIFSRAIARAVLLDNIIIGGKWTKNYAQLVIDLTVPFVVQNCTFKDNKTPLEIEAITHARKILQICSDSVSSDFETLILEEQSKEKEQTTGKPKVTIDPEIPIDGFKFSDKMPF